MGRARRFWTTGCTGRDVQASRRGAGPRKRSATWRTSMQRIMCGAVLCASLVIDNACGGDRNVQLPAAPTPAPPTPSSRPAFMSSMKALRMPSTLAMVSRPNTRKRRSAGHRKCFEKSASIHGTRPSCRQVGETSSQPPLKPARRSPSTTKGQRRMSRHSRPERWFSIIRTTGPWSSAKCA
jgi:hypothetical protein